MALEEYGAMKIHTPIISFLLGVGLFANIVFLMSLKADNSKLSYSEKIQVYKTSLVIMAMMIELSLIQTKHVSMVACIVKDILQCVFLDSFPVGILAISITRFRLVRCHGNNDMHVGKRFFIFIITGCSTISMFTALLKLMFAVTMVTSIETIDINSTSVKENVCCYCHRNTAQITKLVGIALMYVIPVVLVICIYTRILYTTSVSISRVQHARVSTCEDQNLGQSLMPNYVHQSMPSETDDLKGAKIWKSILTLIGFFLVVTIPVSSLEIWLCIKEYNTALGTTLLYLKTLMCIFHAGGEGTFHFDKRERTRLFLYKHVIRTPTSTTLTRRNSKENVAVPTTLSRHVNHLSTLNEVSTPSSSCKINVCHNQDEVVNFVNNITKSNEYDNEAFLKQRSEDEVKTKEPSHCWETTDQLRDSRNSPKTPVRCGSTFMNYRIPSAAFED